MRRRSTDELRELGNLAPEVIQDEWRDDEEVTRRLPTNAPAAVRVPAAFWDSLPRASKAWVLALVLVISAGLCAYALHLGFVPSFLR